MMPIKENIVVRFLWTESNIEMPFWQKIVPLGTGLSSLLLVLWEMEANARANVVAPFMFSLGAFHLLQK